MSLLGLKSSRKGYDTLVYTMEVTYPLDMGIVGPAALVCLFQLKKRKGIGYKLAGMLFTLSIIIGVMIPIQTVFQASAGITMTAAAVVTKAGTFMVLAAFALYFNIRMLKSIK